MYDIQKILNELNASPEHLREDRIHIVGLV